MQTYLYDTSYRERCVNRSYRNLGNLWIGNGNEHLTNKWWSRHVCCLHQSKMVLWACAQSPSLFWTVRSRWNQIRPKWNQGPIYTMPLCQLLGIKGLKFRKTRISSSIECSITRGRYYKKRLFLLAVSLTFTGNKNCIMIQRNTGERLIKDLFLKI